jgi:hypothetical protein
MAGILVAALLVVFIVSLAMYTSVRYMGKRKRENNLAANKLAGFSSKLDVDKTMFFTLNDAELDKLEYVGDTAKI